MSDPSETDATGPYYPAPAGERLVPGALLVGRYRIVAALGRGGMGEVYRADDLTLGQSVALKFLPTELARDPERLARFHAEVRIARQVSHPYVCRVYDVAEADGQPFLTMEYIDGEDLAAVLRRMGGLPEEKGIELARQLCLGLAAAHDRGVIHRDLKPANVMIDGQGQVRLTDFGLATAIGPVDDVRSGTPAYRGHSVYFEIMPARQEADQANRRPDGILIALLVGVIVLAVRNPRQGRGDGLGIANGQKPTPRFGGRFTS